MEIRSGRGNALLGVAGLFSSPVSMRNAYNNDLDNVEVGIVYYYADTDNKPSTGGICFSATKGDFGIQIAKTYNSSSYFIRGKYEDTWSTWKQLTLET